METLDVREGNERRKRLLQQLLAQAQQQGLAGGAPSAAPAFGNLFRRAPLGASRIARNRSDARSARPGITLATQINPALAARLGAAGMHRGNAHDHSEGPGLPVTPPAPPKSHSPIGGGLLPPAPPGWISAGGPMAPSSGTNAESPHPLPGVAPDAPMIWSNPLPPENTGTVGSNLVPVAPGVYYDINADTFRGAGPRAADGAMRHFVR
jgi:hypothetical protein